MIEVRFHWSTGGIDLELPAIPRIGDMIVIHGRENVDARVKDVEFNIYAASRGYTEHVVLVTLEA